MFNTSHIRKSPYNIGKIAASANSKHVILLGQSNAVGVGLTSSLPSDLIGQIANANIFDISRFAWEVLQGGVNNRCAADGPTVNTQFGIEMRLMKSLVSYYNAPQYLNKYARQSTNLRNITPTWAFDASYNASLAIDIDNLFLKSVDVFRYAFRILPIDINPTWLVWMQGENDANGGSGYYSIYQTNLTNFINAYRMAVGNGTNLKVILVKLGDNQTAVDATGRAAVNTAMSNIAGSLTNVFYCTHNATCRPDNIHYDEAGLDTIASAVYDIIIAN